MMLNWASSLLPMNLVNDPWIPVVYLNGNPGQVSLREAFLRGDEIADLAVRPHERIALLRLLICVAQAALNGPVDREEWSRCGGKLTQAAEQYLLRWSTAFELFGG